MTVRDALEHTLYLGIAVLLARPAQPAAARRPVACRVAGASRPNRERSARETRRNGTRDPTGRCRIPPLTYIFRGSCPRSSTIQRSPSISGDLARSHPFQDHVTAKNYSPAAPKERAFALDTHGGRFSVPPPTTTYDKRMSNQKSHNHASASLRMGNSRTKKLDVT